jgi:fatty-acid desaturase
MADTALGDQGVSSLPALAERKLALPAGVIPLKPDWPQIVLIGGYHILAALAFFPHFFSWGGLALAVLSAQVTGVLGINLCYHRLLAHRGFRIPKRLEHFFVVLAVLCLQDTPARWVAVHRRHHEYADEVPDPHSPLANFIWAHMGWLLFKNRELSRLGIYDRYAKDILRDPFYVRLERNLAQIKINLLQLPLLFAAGFVASSVCGEAWSSAALYGVSIMLFGSFVRTVLVWHQTWSVNSIAHLWGYRTYRTDERSRNNILVGLLANGEGWHNNHHAEPKSARHGHRWWELDTTYLVIRLLVALKLATEVALPAAARLEVK